MAYCCIHPGQLWLDTVGRPIQAHGLSVFRNEVENLWYQYGENKEKTLYFFLKEKVSKKNFMPHLNRCNTYICAR